jgi:hypothetical protein
VTECVREIDQATLIGPLTEVVADGRAVQEVWRALGLKRGQDLCRQISVRDKDEFGVLTCLVLEGSDDLPDRFVLPRVEALLPPDDRAIQCWS